MSEIINLDKTRVDYIDASKGIGIILVVVGHIVYGNRYDVSFAEFLTNCIFSFHMPLFFVLSGVCIKSNKALNKETLIAKSKSLLIPYCEWTIIYSLLFCIICLYKKSWAYFDSTQQIHAITLCGLSPLWFLFALYISEIIVLAIKAVKHKLFVLLGLLFGSMLLSYCYNQHWFTTNNSFLNDTIIGLLRVSQTTFFLFLGYLSKDIINAISQLKGYQRLLIFIPCVVLFAFFCKYYNNKVDLHLFIIENPILYVFKAILGCLIVIIISTFFKTGLFVFLGRKTKQIMILHYPPFYYTYFLASILNKLFSPNLLGLIIITVITIVCCLLIDAIMRKTKIWHFLMGIKSTVV